MPSRRQPSVDDSPQDGGTRVERDASKHQARLAAESKRDHVLLPKEVKYRRYRESKT